MDTQGESKIEAQSSTGLLSRILAVLERIDAHLESQDGRIRQLDSKITGITSGENARMGQIENNLGADIPETAYRVKRTNSLQRLNPARRQGLSLQTTVRNHSNASSENWPPTRRPTNIMGAQRLMNVNDAVSESPISGVDSISKIETVSRTPTWGSHRAPPTTAEIDRRNNRDHDIEDNNLITYSRYPAPQSWIITRSQGRALDVKYGTEEAKELWQHYVGDSWTIPPDGRIEMTFQQHILERLERVQALPLLETLQDVSNKLEYREESDPTKRGSFKVTDYDFDPNFEESVAEYRSEIPTGPFRKHRVEGAIRKNSLDCTHSAPWKRIIEVRGLSKKLIDGHEMWTSNFRDPWNEALPVVNSICPFLTNRAADSNDVYAGMRTVDEALLHHQQCWRRPPRCDDGLCFHITFYELIDVSHQRDLDGEIWRSGRLHSENEEELERFSGIKCRRLRESACTIVAVTDLDPLLSRFWTLLYLCPNTFELYDKSHNFERYDTVSASIRGQDTNDALATMIQFSLRMVLLRWEKIAEYFAWLMGHHRDILSDPDAHDSLLFDDDSFSRSRKYFWAINYLAELDSSISGNIVEVERFARNRVLGDQLSRLKYIRGKLRAQREDAIALRDGLFNASGVMESRASTRLGENVKLLTFVSIFFLPLSFCMSVWSVNDTFSLKSLAIVAILVGLSTYFIVFNLNNMVSICKSTYTLQKARIVDQMKNDPNKNWSEQAKRFGAFRPKLENIKPSEWKILHFIIYKILRELKNKVEFSSVTRKDHPRGSGGKTTTSISDWPALPFSWDATPISTTAEQATVAVEETQKKSSIAGGLARLSIMFRRGAVSRTRATGV